MERQAPEAIATAVTATCVIADVTAPWAELDPAATAIMFPEERTELRDAVTANSGKIGPKTHRNFADLPMKKRFFRIIKEVLEPTNMVEEWHEDISCFGGCVLGKIHILLWDRIEEEYEDVEWCDTVFCLSEKKEGNEWLGGGKELIKY